MGNKKEEGKTRHAMQVLQWEGGGRWGGGGWLCKLYSAWEGAGRWGRRAVTPQ